MRHVQLRAFHMVAKHGGFSRAAEALNLTQPAISDQVRKLELQYDILLFNRKKKQVSLTPDGEKLMEITNRLFEVEQQALDFLNESRALHEGTLRIIADSAFHLTTVLGRFRARHPRVRIEFSSGNTNDVVNALHNYTADIGVLGEVPRSKDFSILHLGASQIVGFAAKDFPLPSVGLRLKEVAKLPLVMRERGSKTRQKIIDYARCSAITLTPTITAEGRDAVREIVASGAGIGFVSLAEFGHDDRFRQVNIPDLNITMDEALITLKERENGRLIKSFMAAAAKTG